MPRARAPLHLAPVLQLIELAAQLGYALADGAPVQLDLLLAGSAGLAEAAALALEVRPAAHQARRQVLELRQLDLELALARARALPEDLQDQLGAVEHAAAELPFEVALLGAGQLMVEDHARGVERARGLADLAHLAAAGEVLRVRPAAPAGDERVPFRTRTLGQALEFADRFVEAVGTEIEADQDRRAGIGGDCGGALQQVAGFSLQRRARG